MPSEQAEAVDNFKLSNSMLYRPRRTVAKAKKKALAMISSNPTICENIRVAKTTHGRGLSKQEVTEHFNPMS